jgi:hypothetical protein
LNSVRSEQTKTQIRIRALGINAKGNHEDSATVRSVTMHFLKGSEPSTVWAVLDQLGRDALHGVAPSISKDAAHELLEFSHQDQPGSKALPIKRLAYDALNDRPLVIDSETAKRMVVLSYWSLNCAGGIPEFDAIADWQFESLDRDYPSASRAAP